MTVLLVSCFGGLYEIMNVLQVFKYDKSAIIFFD